MRWIVILSLGCAADTGGGATCDEAAADPEARDLRGWVAAPGDTCRREVFTPPDEACAEITIAYATADGRCWWFSCYLAPPAELATLAQTTTTNATLTTGAGGTCDLTAMTALPACDDDAVLLCAEDGAVVELPAAR